jgi:hypothetical protein
MSFCEHCQGQRFDRAQVLRALRQTRRKILAQAPDRGLDQILAIAINEVRTLEIPHLEFEPSDDAVVH